MGEAGWDVRKRCREGGDADTSGCAPGYLQVCFVLFCFVLFCFVLF